MPVVDTKETVNTIPDDLQASLFTTVPYADRADFIASRFGNNAHDAALFERELLKTARYMDSECETQMWEMVAVEGGCSKAFFMYPSIDKGYKLSQGNDDGSQCDLVDNKLFGLIATLTCFDEASDRSEEESEYANLLNSHWYYLYGNVGSYMENAKTNNDVKNQEAATSLLEFIAKHSPIVNKIT
jgi:hypothetical protein